MQMFQKSASIRAIYDVCLVRIFFLSINNNEFWNIGMRIYTAHLAIICQQNERLFRKEVVSVNYCHFHILEWSEAATHRCS